MGIGVRFEASLPSLLTLYFLEGKIMKNSNYWTWKDSEIVAQLEEYGITFEKEHYSRKDAIDTLKVEEAKRAKTAAVVVDEETNETSYVEELKKKDPQLEVLKVIFHHTGEQDIPYVFVGHNGKSFYLPKETEIEVPVYILNSCIKDAVEDRMMPKVNPQNGDINWIMRKVQRYPYSIVDTKVRMR
jgi:hypothetical protein